MPQVWGAPSLLLCCIPSIRWGERRGEGSPLPQRLLGPQQVRKTSEAGQCKTGKTWERQTLFSFNTWMMLCCAPVMPGKAIRLLLAASNVEARTLGGNWEARVPSSAPVDLTQPSLRRPNLQGSRHCHL